MLRKQPPTGNKPLLRRPRNVPPLYVPNPDSLLPHRRCFRVECRAVKPAGAERCPACGSLIDSTEPLVKYTVYVEEFVKDGPQF